MESKQEQAKINCAKVKKGDLMAFVYYAKVTKATKDVLDVESIDQKGMNFKVEGKELIENGFSADQYKEEIKVSMTRAAEILISSYNKPLTVCFSKADGKERILRGRLVNPEPLLGRSMVEDLDISDENRLRLVDHRTIKYIIVDCIKHTVK